MLKLILLKSAFLKVEIRKEERLKMKGNIKFIVLVMAIFLTFFVLARQLVEARSDLKKTREEAIKVKMEKAGLRSELIETQDKLSKAEKSLMDVQQELVFLGRKAGVIKRDNSELRKSKLELERKVALLTQEKQIIEARLHSLRELKKAIREVRAEESDKKIALQREIDARELALGNRGFMIKDGRVCGRPEIKIEVMPAGLSISKRR